MISPLFRLARPAGSSLLLLTALAALPGCRSSSTDAPAVQGTTKPTVVVDAAPPKPPAGTPAALIAARPYRLISPPKSNAAASGQPLSLVLLLHGYGGNAIQMERVSRLSSVAEKYNLAIAAPDGTPDSGGRRFWNATDSCCNFESKKVDDVAYLSAVIDDATTKLGVDPKHVFVIGHSNGGFMALRLACDISPKIAAVVSMAGAGYADASRCQPTTKVSVLDIHGDADTMIPYTGGTSPRLPDAAPFASAKDTVNAWATYDGCTGKDTTRGKDGGLGALRASGHLDITDDLPGTETDRASAQGCPDGVEVELWTVKGGEHQLTLTDKGVEQIVAFLETNPKL